MSIKDHNVRKLLLRIKEVRKIPEKLMVVRCTECGDTIFIPAEQSQESIEYWKSIYLNKGCRWRNQRECSGIYREIKLTLEKIDRMLKPDNPEITIISADLQQLTLSLIIPPNKKSN